MGIAGRAQPTSSFFCSCMRLARSLAYGPKLGSARPIWDWRSTTGLPFCVLGVRVGGRFVGGLMRKWVAGW